MKKRLITIGVIVIVAIAAITTTIIVTSGGKEKSPRTSRIWNIIVSSRKSKRKRFRISMSA